MNLHAMDMVLAVLEKWGESKPGETFGRSILNMVFM
jgi:hypothetical protein